MCFHSCLHHSFTHFVLAHHIFLLYCYTQQTDRCEFEFTTVHRRTRMLVDSSATSIDNGIHSFSTLIISTSSLSSSSISSKLQVQRWRTVFAFVTLSSLICWWKSTLARFLQKKHHIAKLSWVYFCRDISRRGEEWKKLFALMKLLVMRFTRSKPHFSSSTLLPSRHTQNHSRSRSSSSSARVGEFSQMSSYTSAAEWATVSNGSSNCCETDLILPSFKLHSTRSISALLARLHHRQCHAHRCLEKFSLFFPALTEFGTQHTTLGCSLKNAKLSNRNNFIFSTWFIKQILMKFPSLIGRHPKPSYTFHSSIISILVEKKKFENDARLFLSNFSLACLNYRIHGIYFVMREQHRSN